MTCINCRITMAIEPLRDEDGNCYCGPDCKEEYLEKHAPDVKNFYEEQLAEMLLSHKPRRNVKAFFHTKKLQLV